MLSYSLRMLKKAAKARDMLPCTDEFDNMRQQMYELSIKQDLDHWKKAMDLTSRLHEIYLETVDKKKVTFYAVTVRPDESKCSFLEFYDTCRKYSERKMIVSMTTSFEQKGTNEESLGKGFHAHFVITNCTWKNKAQVLRDTQSTFNKIAAPNCVKVIPSNDDPDHYIKYYLVDYLSEDNHKETTKTWDQLWRQKHNINELYEGPLPVRAAVSSTVQQPLSDPFLVSW